MSDGPSLLRALVLAGLTLVCARVEAQARSPDDELRIATREHGSWPETVAALQADLGAEGRRVHVVVFDASSHVARCGRYALSLDPAGMRAFAVGSCDPATDATELVLVSRTELFSHDGPVPIPRAIVLAASELRIGADSGGAALTGGALLECSIVVRPYLDDLEHGTVVYLGADRYDVRPDDVSVLVAVETDGWSLHARSLAAVTIAYAVVDRADGAVVLRDRATLACGDAPSPSPPLRPEPPPSAAAEHVLVLESTDLPGLTEVVGVLDVHEPVGDEARALRLLRERAAAIGADAVVGVEFHHGEGDGGPIHLSGLAVRFLERLR